MSFESMQEELCQSGRDAMKADGVKSLAEAWEKCPRVDWMWAMLKAAGKRDSVPKRVWQDLAVYAAESVIPIFEARYPGNGIVRNCIAVTKDFLNGSATKEQLIQARDKAAAAACAAACDAAYAAYAYAYAAYAAAYAADAAAYAAAAAARATKHRELADKLRELTGFNPLAATDEKVNK